MVLCRIVLYTGIVTLLLSCSNLDLMEQNFSVLIIHPVRLKLVSPAIIEISHFASLGIKLLRANNKGSGQTVVMCRIDSIFIVRMQQNKGFLL